LSWLAERFERLGEVRGKGLMLGVEVSGDPLTIMDASLQVGLLHNTAGSAIRFLPPLIISEAEVDEGLNRLETALLRAA
jgi:4-aminobutyrate aminotransferase-like enzyme